MHKKCLKEMFFHMMDDVLMNHEELGISKSDKKKFAGLKMNTKRAMIKDRYEVDMIMVDIKGALWQDPIDIEGMNKMIDKKYDLKREGMKQLVKAFAELKKMLSDDQMHKLWKLCKAQKHEVGSCSR